MDDDGEDKIFSLVVLTGFRATGKTVVGRFLAELLGYQFIDTDEEIVTRMKCSIVEAVSCYGWEYFRFYEQNILEELGVQKNLVIATGGGAILHQVMWRELCKRAFVVWLRSDLSTTLLRLERDERTVEQRPCFGEGVQDWKTETANLLLERESLYQVGSDMFLETEDRTPEVLAGLVYRRVMQREMA